MAYLSVYGVCRSPSSVALTSKYGGSFDEQGLWSAETFCIGWRLVSYRSLFCDSLFVWQACWEAKAKRVRVTILDEGE